MKIPKASFRVTSQSGPHEYVRIQRFVDEYCQQIGWKWLSRASRVSHVNILELRIFTAISKINFNLIRTIGGLRVASHDDIWKFSKGVWEKLPNENILFPLFSTGNTWKGDKG